jgi:hypothetical protein
MAATSSDSPPHQAVPPGRPAIAAAAAAIPWVRPSRPSQRTQARTVARGKPSDDADATVTSSRRRSAGSAGGRTISPELSERDRWSSPGNMAAAVAWAAAENDAVAASGLRAAAPPDTDEDGGPIEVARRCASRGSPPARGPGPAEAEGGAVVAASDGRRAPPAVDGRTSAAALAAPTGLPLGRDVASPVPLHLPHHRSSRPSAFLMDPHGHHRARSRTLTRAWPGRGRRRRRRPARSAHPLLALLARTQRWPWARGWGWVRWRRGVARARVVAAWRPPAAAGAAPGPGPQARRALLPPAQTPTQSRAGRPRPPRSVGVTCIGLGVSACYHTLLSVDARVRGLVILRRQRRCRGP